MAQGSAGPPAGLFRGTTGDWRNIAMLVGTTTASVPYAACFKEAGDALVDRGLATHTQDLVFFPALYCYRHAVETVMKEIAYQRISGRLTGARFPPGPSVGRS